MAINTDMSMCAFATVSSCADIAHSQVARRSLRGGSRRGPSCADDADAVDVYL